MATGVEDIVQVSPELAEMTAKWHAANGVIQDMATLVEEGDARERALRAEVDDWKRESLKLARETDVYRAALKRLAPAEFAAIAREANAAHAK